MPEPEEKKQRRTRRATPEAVVFPVTIRYLPRGARAEEVVNGLDWRREAGFVVLAGWDPTLPGVKVEHWLNLADVARMTVVDRMPRPVRYEEATGPDLIEPDRPPQRPQAPPQGWSAKARARELAMGRLPDGTVRSQVLDDSGRVTTVEAGFMDGPT